MTKPDEWYRVLVVPALCSVVSHPTLPSQHGPCSYDVVLFLHVPVQLRSFRFIRCRDLDQKFQRSSMSTLEASHLSPLGEASGVSSKKTDYQLVVTLVGMKICCDPLQSRNVDIYRLYF